MIKSDSIATAIWEYYAFRTPPKEYYFFLRAVASERWFLETSKRDHILVGDTVLITGHQFDNVRPISVSARAGMYASPSAIKKYVNGRPELAELFISGALSNARTDIFIALRSLIGRRTRYTVIYPARRPSGIDTGNFIAYIVKEKLHTNSLMSAALYLFDAHHFAALTYAYAAEAKQGTPGFDRAVLKTELLSRNILYIGSVQDHKTYLDALQALDPPPWFM